MTALLLIFTGSFVVALSGALAPGPLLFYTISKTPKHGSLTGVFVIFGHAVLEILIVVLLLFGIKSLFNKTVFEIIISLTGGITLILMGILTIIPAIKNKTGLELENKKYENKFNYGLLAGGFLISISNPYFLIWWIFIGAGYMYASLKFGIIGLIVFFAGHILADFAWYFFVSLCVDKSKKLINNTFYKYLMITCSILIVLMGLYFLTNGIKLFTV